MEIYSVLLGSSCTKPETPSHGQMVQEMTRYNDPQPFCSVAPFTITYLRIRYHHKHPLLFRIPCFFHKIWHFGFGLQGEATRGGMAHLYRGWLLHGCPGFDSWPWTNFSSREDMKARHPPSWGIQGGGTSHWRTSLNVYEQSTGEPHLKGQ